MQYALDEAGRKVAATPRTRGTCELCKAVMIAKCGSTVIHHWAHEAAADCDPWWEPESEWHRNWKEMFPPSCREVVLAPHRADVRLPSGLVVELQSSSIPAADIAAREHHYDTMIWVFDAVQPYRDGRLVCSMREAKRGNMQWDHARRSIACCTKPVYLDIGAGTVLYLPKPRLAAEQPLFGDVILDNRDDFVGRVSSYPYRALRNWLGA